MEKFLYLMLMENKNPINGEVVKRHVEHLKRLDAAKKLVLCGPFTDFGGGMVIFKTATKEEANALAASDPFISEGYKTYRLMTLEAATAENNFLV